MNESPLVKTLRSSLVILSILWLANTALFARQLILTEMLFTSRRLTLILAGEAAITAVCIFMLAASLLMKETRARQYTQIITGAFQRLGALNYLAFGLLGLAYPWLIMGFLGGSYVHLESRLALFTLLAYLGYLLLRAASPGHPWWEGAIATALSYAALHRFALYLPDISSNPFSLSWSEASRYYYASLFFSDRLYGVHTTPSVLHPSRYMMQALPFLLPNSTILVHRAWQVMLWVGVTALSAVGFARRVQASAPLQHLAAIAWAFLLLLLGPVYYHLQVPALLVLWLYHLRKPWQTLAVVAVASAWAGISRVNWFPVPGLLAAALFLIEEPVHGQSIWRYLRRPFVWTVVGTSLAFASQAIYALWSGNPEGQFTTSFTSDLLWYRLLPNPTYPAGILPVALLVSLPFAIIFAIKYPSLLAGSHPIRLAGLTAILLLLFGGGLVVSTKIGGGSNLHNLDAYLVVLMTVGGLVLFNRYSPEPPGQQPPVQQTTFCLSRYGRLLLGVSVLGAVVTPSLPTIIQGNKIQAYDQAQIQQELEDLQRLVDASSGGEILLITQRQLLTFDYLYDIRLVPDYEKVFLMEMAMAENPAYLDQFWQDLEHQRFELILSDTLFTRLKGATYIFGEENDAWVRNVAQKILCDYKPVETFKLTNIQLLARRERGRDCPILQSGGEPDLPPDSMDD